MKRSLMLISVLGTLLLGACATRVSSEVTTFHHLPPPNGEVITVKAADPAKAGSLEFANYRELVAQHLHDLGYDVQKSDSACHLVARMDYRVGRGETRIDTYPASSHVWYYFHYRTYSPYWYGWREPWWDTARVYAYTVYPRQLTLTIERSPGCTQGKPGERLFEGKVVSVGRSRNLPEIMPYMISAMFQNFPGESGMTKVVTIKGEHDGDGPK